MHPVCPGLKVIKRSSRLLQDVEPSGFPCFCDSKTLVEKSCVKLFWRSTVARLAAMPTELYFGMLLLQEHRSLSAKKDGDNKEVS